jgi:hypothetical protein
LPTQENTERIAANRAFAALAFVLCGSALIVSARANATAACEPDQVCGMKNAEDLVAVPGTQWAIASRLAKDPEAPGGFYLVDLDKLTARVLQPEFSKSAAQPYLRCPGAPAAAELVTHGLDLRQMSNGLIELFAVNHGGRQSIEVFDLQVKKGGVALKWKGCVTLPTDMSANAVVALADGVAVTSFGSEGDQGTADLFAGKPSGYVASWTSKVGWTRVAGSDFGGDNGISAAADGSALYVNDWGDGTLRVLPLRAGISPATIQLGEFHPDNVHLLPNGNLLISGQIGSPGDIMRCASEPACGAGSMIAVVDPKLRRVQACWPIAASGTFGAAATALQYGRDYWLSSFRGDRIVRVGPAPVQD